MKWEAVPSTLRRFIPHSAIGGRHSTRSPKHCLIFRSQDNLEDQTCPILPDLFSSSYNDRIMDEVAPPTYEKATIVDHWNLVARYIPSSDLCSAALVCSRWHSTFAPHLWGNPASHFGIENDRVYVALTKFKRTLQTARLLVRALTHTLHLPPAHAEIYNGPHADWLRDVLERLPNLQALIVRGLPFFDHSALWALKYNPPKAGERGAIPAGVLELPASSGSVFQRNVDFVPSFGLRLLDASRCPNVTSSSLAQALGRFEGLLYVDLSYTYPARDPVVLKTLRYFTGLQVLKIRGVGLTDEGLGVVSRAIGRRVRSLDIRDNHVTDRGVRTLLDDCFIAAGSGGGNLQSGQRSPALLPYMGAEMLDIYQGEEFESFLRNAFTGRFIGRLAIEDAPEGGITHLYVTGNDLSVEGVSGLIRSGRLHVLDVESVATGLARHLSTPYDANDSSLDTPGVEKLTPMISKHATDTMTFLRIDHALVTKDAPNFFPDEVVQGRAELGDPDQSDLPKYHTELDGTSVHPEVFEMPAVSTPTYELPGDPMQFVVSPAMNDTQHDIDEEQSPTHGIRRGSAFAPEVVDTLTAETDQLALLSPVSAFGEGTLMNLDGAMSPTSPMSSPLSETFGAMHPWGIPPRPRSFSSIVDERKARLNGHKANKRNLHPAMLPRVRTLVLTDVPPFSSNKEISDRLICFISQCAEEAWLAKSQADLDYSLPPGRRGHATALKQSAEKVFALKRVVLELAPPSGPRRSSKASPWSHTSTKSMTEDRDSEALWSAAETDFSFFGDDDYSFPSLESGRFAHAQRSNEKEVNFHSDHQRRPSNSTQKAPVPQTFDTVALISAFRKERKLAHQRSVATGSVHQQTEGYWEGLVQVVRPGSGLRQDEQEDYYGNRFENGYLYR